MSAAAMSINDLNRNHPGMPHVAAGMEPAGFVAWMRTVEGCMTALGARCLLEHVASDRWLWWFEQGEDAQTAVMRELAEVAD